MGAEIVICGDYNAHTNIKPDYFNSDWATKITEIDDIVKNTNNERLQLINCMYEDHRLDRFSEDMRPMNNNGRLLLDICKISGLIIVNGRLGDDKGVGRATRVMGDHSTVVDYVIATPKLFDQITHFQIHDKLPESDHLPLIFKIKCNGTHPGQYHLVDSDWKPQKGYCWSTPDLDNLKTILDDDISNSYVMNIYDALADLMGTNEIATTVNDLITQAADRAFRVTWGVRGSRCMAPRWYDAECRRLRSQAVKAGENLASEHDKANLTAIFRQYKSFKQKKKRSYRNDNIRIIEQSGNSPDFWKVLNKICPSSQPVNQPTGTEFVDYFKGLCNPERREYFDYSYEREAVEFLKSYDKGQRQCLNTNETAVSALEREIINSSFREDEISEAIKLLKNDKSPGVDCIPAEFIKYCRNILCAPITTVLNYIIEQRDFPGCWGEGLRSAIFKTGQTDIPEN